MTRRWVCPKCDAGCLAPSRPRKDDVKRFCLPCSKKVGRLVERVCPAANNAKAREDAERKAKRDANRAASQVQRTAEREQHAHARDALKSERAALKAVPIGELAMLRGRQAFEEAARRYAKLKAWEQDLSGCACTIRLSVNNQISSGLAWGSSGEGRFTVTAGSDIADVHATILHELAHLAAPPESHHGIQWRLFFRAAVAEVIGRMPYCGPPQGTVLDKESFHGALKRELALFLYGGAT